MNFTLKVTKNRATIQMVRTHSIRRFLNNLRTINWQNGPLKVYLRVSYGKQECSFGCVCNFYNDGYYETEQEFMGALDAFTERA